MSATAMYDVMGPLARRRARRWTVAGTLVVVAIVLGGIWQLQVHGLLKWKVWSILVNQDFARLIIDGAIATLKVALVSIVLSFAGGLLLTMLGRSRFRVIR
ncbi:MAG: hypothetical protein L0H14_12085 [Yaniella sp.]|uniref:hypothetical protein n=1 Tax=Yaniella sp. TaxID=2773929 RepID=UPI00264A0539|nr:hypothetical protein [Yaniella sp.]MDN5732544.1 hypothetical protein [Yaniella sp.]